MKKFTRILPVLMIAILSTFITEIHGRVLAPLSTEGWVSTAKEVNIHPIGCDIDFFNFTNIGCYLAAERFRPVTLDEGSGSAEMYSYPLATGTLAGNVKNCATNANLASVVVTIMSGLPVKDCTANVTVIVSLSCPLVKPDNATVTLSRHNPGNPPPVYDSVYVLVTDTTGIVHFTNLCNGIYDLAVKDFGYDLYMQSNLTITGDTTISLTLRRIVTPPPAPTGLVLNNQTLLATWARPHFSLPILTETWDHGNFTDNQWTTSGSAAGNWIVGVFGYPSSSAEFNGSPRQNSYEGYLTSKVLTGLHSPVVKLNYDIYLYNNDVVNVNTMAVELWNGTSWTVLKTYTNQGGNILWSHQQLDISTVTNSVFQIRFHTAGTNSSSINNWNIDNIIITATGPPGNDPCLLGYNFYLNNTLIGTTPDTFYTIPPYRVVYGSAYNACVAAVYDSGISRTSCVTFASRFLSPVTNLTVTAVTNAAYLTWTKPQYDTVLIGYNVYQIIDGQSKFHHYVPGPDSLRTYCFNIEDGINCFDVTAKYDLSVFGYPGTFGESLNETPGPVCADWVSCCILPFLEPWTSGLFSFQQWTAGPNWSINVAVGNPPPSADFRYTPLITDYNSSLTSVWINSGTYTCASIWLDFDYKLNDHDANGTEKMDVEIKWDHAWHKEAEYTNNGSVNWTSQHLDISASLGQDLSVRFRANGANSQHILDWYIDNIKVYAVCSSPVALTKTQAYDTINLSWSPPQCGPIGKFMCFIFDDGTPESGWAISPGLTAWLGNLFPVGDSVSGNIHSFDILWNSNPVATNQDFRIDVFSQAGALLGSSQSFQVPIPPPATFVTVTLANDIPFTGPFYGMIKWNNFAGPTNFLGFDEDLPNAAQNLAFYYNGATFTHISVEAGDGIPGIFTERACAFTFGEDKRPDSNQLMGYNVFRYDSIASGVVNFHKINTAIIPTLSYSDYIGPDTMKYGFYKYFVTAIFNNSVTQVFLCESPGSDTIAIRFPQVGGVEELSNGSVLLYPNPVNDVVNVKSDFNISRIEVLNFIGQTAYIESVTNPKLVKINTSYLQPGVYFIKVTTSNGIRAAKITVLR